MKSPPVPSGVCAQARSRRIQTQALGPIAAVSGTACEMHCRYPPKAGLFKSSALELDALFQPSHFFAMSQKRTACRLSRRSRRVLIQIGTFRVISRTPSAKVPSPSTPRVTWPKPCSQPARRSPQRSTQRPPIRSRRASTHRPIMSRTDLLWIPVEDPAVRQIASRLPLMSSTTAACRGQSRETQLRRGRQQGRGQCSRRGAPREPRASCPSRRPAPHRRGC